LAELVRAFGEKFDEMGSEAKEAIRNISQEAQYELDKQMGKAMASHPELYAEIRKTMRQAKRTLNKVAENFGFREP
jgi:hypothetical protein